MLVSTENCYGELRQSLLVISKQCNEDFFGMGFIRLFIRVVLFIWCGGGDINLLMRP